MTIDDFADDRGDAERAADALVGRRVALGARQLLADGASPRSVASALLSSALAVALEHYGQEATHALLVDTAADVACLRMGAGTAGRA